MAKVKVILEIEEEIYNAIKKQYEEAPIKFSFPQLENYLVFIISSYVQSNEQIKKMTGQIGNIFNNIDPTTLGGLDFNEIIKKYKAKSDGDKSKPSEEDKKKENLKN
jgi:hypothetical protein